MTTGEIVSRASIEDDDVRFVERSQYLATIEGLKTQGYNVCIDVTSVDYSKVGDARVLPVGVVGARFEIVVNLLSHRLHHRIRIRVQVPDDDPNLESLYELYPGVEAMEREVFDLMGIVFSNHPDLTRVLMPEDWEGHPLRKDYSQGRIPVQFKYPEGKGTAVTDR